MYFNKRKGLAWSCILEDNNNKRPSDGTYNTLPKGVKGKIYSKLQNKSQRSVIFGVNEKHSKKPDSLQDKLELMFPDCAGHFLEMFARRDKPNWTCIGNQCPSSFGEDIRVSLERIAKL